jgi:hypothetical protein
MSMAFSMMTPKGTLFHVTDADAWSTKFPDANVTFVGDLTTGIKEISNRQVEGARYNLSGQRVSDGYKGIVIMNGRKVLTK